ncbi:MAG: hypothetical protein V1811_01925 [Candidatus Micrarchaeota archaeon]
MKPSTYGGKSISSLVKSGNVVIKKFGDDSLPTAYAEKLAREILHYDSELARLGMRTPKLINVSITDRPSGKSIVLVRRRAGTDYGDLLKKASTPVTVKNRVRKLLEAIKPLLMQKVVTDSMLRDYKTLHLLPLPIDARPQNFVQPSGGGALYVDVTPPLVRNKTSLEFWEPSAIRISDFLFRRLDSRGVVQNLLSHTVTAAIPAYRRVVEKEFLAFLKENDFLAEHDHVKKYVGTKEYRDFLKRGEPKLRARRWSTRSINLIHPAKRS